MRNILEAPFMRGMRKVAGIMYDKFWDERNGGNISLMLDEEEVAPYLDLTAAGRLIPMAFDASFLAGRLFLVTGTGKYFMNIPDDPENNLGLIRVAADGHGVEVLWGYADGGAPTSELPAHFMSHIERLKINPNNRVVMHTHATNLLAMTFVEELTDKNFTRILWQMCTECMVVFPDGVGVLPWMVCGGDEIGRATADKMKDFRLVIWAQHGIFGVGESLDETLGLIETAEKAAAVYIKIQGRPWLQTITDAQLQTLADAFGVTPKAGYLNL